MRESMFYRWSSEDGEASLSCEVFRGRMAECRAEPRSNEAGLTRLRVGEIDGRLSVFRVHSDRQLSASGGIGEREGAREREIIRRRPLEMAIEWTGRGTWDIGSKRRDSEKMGLNEEVEEDKGLTQVSVHTKYILIYQKYNVQIDQSMGCGAEKNGDMVPFDRVEVPGRGDGAEMGVGIPHSPFSCPPPLVPDQLAGAYTSYCSGKGKGKGWGGGEEEGSVRPKFAAMAEEVPAFDSRIRSIRLISSSVSVSCVPSSVNANIRSPRYYSPISSHRMFSLSLSLPISPPPLHATNPAYMVLGAALNLRGPISWVDGWTKGGGGTYTTLLYLRPSRREQRDRALLAYNVQRTLQARVNQLGGLGCLGLLKGAPNGPRDIVSRGLCTIQRNPSVWVGEVGMGTLEEKRDDATLTNTSRSQLAESLGHILPLEVAGRKESWPMDLDLGWAGLQRTTYVAPSRLVRFRFRPVGTFGLFHVPGTLLRPGHEPNVFPSLLNLGIPDAKRKRQSPMFWDDMGATREPPCPFPSRKYLIGGTGEGSDIHTTYRTYLALSATLD
ncbi:hypothetical protein ACRALDRAFT_2017096 [Sodiomyces alcalophilus JCM 7366]|uniref:uncharacterized protein n=1 Tax=Sodiomyces alcalophilus JCM 7366 TaxID=591952 RepID=UPI0039B4ED05